VEPRDQLAVLGVPKPVSGGARILVAAALAAFFTGTLAANSDAVVRITRDEALRQIYGERASFRAQTAYLTPTQIERLRQEARAPIEVKRVTWYVASAGDTLLGFGFVDQNVVRTMSETVLTALDARGSVKAVEILVWNEPQDYLPKRRWLDTARGLSDPEKTRPGESLPTIAGATLSARAIAASIRRSLAYYRVLVAGGAANR
jgi:hypothetical protein